MPFSRRRSIKSLLGCLIAEGANTFAVVGAISTDCAMRGISTGGVVASTFVASELGAWLSCGGGGGGGGGGSDLRGKVLLVGSATGSIDGSAAGSGGLRSLVWLTAVCCATEMLPKQSIPTDVGLGSEQQTTHAMHRQPTYHKPLSLCSRQYEMRSSGSLACGRVMETRYSNSETRSVTSLERSFA
jgi:hypothetical protein